jgi:hypothetical protein
VIAAFLVVFGTYSAFSVNTSGPDGDAPGFKKGMKTLKQDSLGTYSDLTSPAKELLAHSNLKSGPKSSLYLTYHSGVQVEILPGSEAAVQANRVKVVRGRVRVRITEQLQGGFFLAVGDLTGRLKEGDMVAALSDSTPVRFSLKAGLLDVKDAKGRRYRLEPSNVMKASGNGLSYVVEESSAEDLAAVEPKGGEQPVQ